MTAVNLVPLQWQELPQVREDTYNRQRWGVSHHFPDGRRVLQNLRNRNPGYVPIARTYPPVKRYVTISQLAGSPATGRLSVEDLRQYVYGARLANGARQYYRFAGQ
jgi:hypothetical protein